MHFWIATPGASTRIMTADSERASALARRIVRCAKCPRLARWRQAISHQKTPRFDSEEYWGKPVPGFGDLGAELLIVGLAPAAHGANRTGRMFTGDRSGEWLFRALHRFGFSDTSVSVSRDDGLVLRDCYVTAAARCAPPSNKPTASELTNCRSYLEEEFTLLRNVRVVLVLGRIAFDATWSTLVGLQLAQSRHRPRFSHGAEVDASDRLKLISSYHPSQQNTFTGKLTEEMFDGVFRRITKILSESS